MGMVSRISRWPRPSPGRPIRLHHRAAVTSSSRLNVRLCVTSLAHGKRSRRAAGRARTQHCVWVRELALVILLVVACCGGHAAPMSKGVIKPTSGRLDWKFSAAVIILSIFVGHAVNSDAKFKQHRARWTSIAFSIECAIIAIGVITLLRDCNDVWQHCHWYIPDPPGPPIAWPTRWELFVLWMPSGAFGVYCRGMEKSLSLAIFPALMLSVMFTIGIIVPVVISVVIFGVILRFILINIGVSPQNFTDGGGNPARPSATVLPSPRGAGAHAAASSSKSIPHASIATAAVRASRSASGSAAVAICNVATCSRGAWNGQPGQPCCRTCRNTNGGGHGPDCNRKAGVGAPAVPVSAAPSAGAGRLDGRRSPGGTGPQRQGRKRKTPGHDADDARRCWSSSRRQGRDAKKLFNVDRGTEEYSQVETQFMATMAGLATIKRIQRVENGHQYEAFLQQKKTIEEEIADLGMHCPSVERLLFHGSKQDSINDVIHGKTAGFEPLASGSRVGAIWGDGTYFARDAKYCHNYSQALASGRREMLLNRVLVGLSTQGKAKTKLYPKVQASLGARYHSLVDQPQCPTIFVVRHSYQAYPSYLITYR